VHPRLAALPQHFEFTGILSKDVPAFLVHHECPNTAIHTRAVVDTTLELSARFNLDTHQAEAAAWLHDISAVFPNEQRLAVSQQLGLEILPEEEQVPLLLHQKISAVIAREIFGLNQQSVLDTIGCHTTLKANPSPLELVVFCADKLAWDQKGIPSYKAEMEAALDQSLEAAAWVYQDYLWHSGKLKIVHPWMHSSYLELKAKYDLL
jgi:predicted HD superfamily hydrolase involved in NAD metabolism